MVEFYGANKRENSRSVIVLMATDYSPTNDPQEIANTFKEDGGILMVFSELSPREDRRQEQITWRHTESQCLCRS